MNQKKTDVSDKNVRTPILGESSFDLNKCHKPYEKLVKKQQRWNLRKLVKNSRDVISIVSLVLSFVKLLEELGLLP